MTATLRELLSDNRRRYAPDYREGLSNHLPMALIALHRLGATDERLRSFHAWYAPRLEPADDGWRTRCASVDVDPTAFWERATRLMDGLGGAAFHGLLRLSFALELGDDPDELVHGFAYLEREHAPMARLDDRGAVAGARSTTRDVLEAVLGLSIDAPKVRTITPRLLAVAQHEAFAATVANLEVGDDTMDQLARAALAAYVHTRAFTALHAFTGTHALRAVLPWLSDPERAIRALFVAAAACLVDARPPTLEMTPAAAPDWRVLAAAATVPEDDHLAKLTFACREEARGGGDDAALRHAAHVAIERGRA